nr:O-antigen ligase family protein [Nitrosomonas nitrosa]
MIDRPIRLEQKPSASAAPISARSILSQSSSTVVERFLLMGAIIMLPLENELPTVAGMSASFLIFGALAIYVVLNRPRALGVIWYHPVFIAAYAFIGVSVLLEFSSPLSSYQQIIRFAQMIAGAVCVAVLCRDRSALAAGLYGYVAAALWVSFLLIMNSYGVLAGMGSASDFDEASQIRGSVDVGFRDNLNRVAFVCTQGAIVAFALSLSARLERYRIILGGIATFSLVASFLTMSRGAFVISLVVFPAMLYTHGFRRYGKVLILAFVLGLSIYALVPDVVWTRMMFTTEMRDDGKMEGRAYVYATAFNRLPEYIVSGVGAGNFYQKWGLEKGFTRGRGVLGLHNTLLQVTVMWGVLGLSMYLWIMWCVYCSIPLRCGNDELSLALLGLFISLALYLLVMHVLADKVFAVAIGLLVGARQGIWPTGIVTAVDAQGEAVR